MAVLSGRIPTGRNVGCQCAGAACDTVSFADLTTPEGIMAISGRASDVVATGQNGSLVFRHTPGGVVWEIVEGAPETEALLAVLDLVAGDVPVYGRPIIDDDRSTFREEGTTRRYSKAVMRALLIKPILNPADRKGWAPATAGDADMERRFVEFRAEGDTITGSVMTYGDEARFGHWRERFEPRSLEVGEDVIVNLQHDRSKPVARTGAGLELRSTDQGVEAELTLPDTVYGREARELVAANILRGFSVEFRAIKEAWEGKTRIIKRAALVGFALVDRPAYPASQIAMRFDAMVTPKRPPRYYV